MPSHYIDYIKAQKEAETYQRARKYADVILGCNKSINEFAQRIKQFTDAEHATWGPNRELSQHLTAELTRAKDFLQQEEAVITFIQSVTSNMIEAVNRKSKSCESFQEYVINHFMSELHFVEEKFKEIIVQLKQLPYVCSEERAVMLETTFAASIANMLAI